MVVTGRYTGTVEGVVMMGTAFTTSLLGGRCKESPITAPAGGAKGGIDESSEVEADGDVERHSQRSSAESRLSRASLTMT